MTITATSVQPAEAAASERVPLDLYDRWFTLLAADTPELRREVFRLRYQVYCVEHAFEDPAEHPEGLEIDAFDERSVHYLLLHRASDAVVGTVRIVLPARAHGRLSLPIVSLCNERHLVETFGLPVASTAEISRFAVSKDFRRRVGDTPFADADYPGLPADGNFTTRRAMPHITLGLMKAVAKMSMENGITHLVAVMEPALLRLVGRLGFQFQSIGPLVQYHGLRQPCYAACDTLGRGLLMRRPDALELITNGGQYWRPDRGTAALGEP